MKKRGVCLFILFFLISCNKNKKEITFQKSDRPIAIVLHGGAGTILKENMSDSLERAYLAKLDEAITLGYQMLVDGKSSLDVVEQVVIILEDSPLFNAGKGAVFTNDGKNELDASIMDGSNQKAGAVAGLTKIKNPISLARLVMDKSEHVMMIGQGAENFAQSHGISFVDATYFYTQQRFEGLKKAQEKEKILLDHDEFSKDDKFGTVGCVALDKNGNIAAATSTGGMTNKRYGRVGDVPIIGAGTYAKNGVCGVSATGWGEYFIRNVVAYDITAQMMYQSKSLTEASKHTIFEKVGKMGGDGGIIAIDKDGQVVMTFNTAGMYRAAIGSDKKKIIDIYK
jgi:beta-aspartyl-peptidase (threonine type)